MAPEADPHRTLGLSRDASPAEIKAAYRRLAKAFHPDAAGEAAIPRFLAIQAAYEQLTGISPTSPRGAAEAWRADPDRARATRDAWRARRPGGAAAGTAGTAGERATNDGAGAWRDKRRDGPGAGERPGSGTARGEGRARSRARRGPASDRAPDRATPGSTTYDFADQEPFDPEWSGASWYGTTSGTYWTINPKEYADPRKHGPEYQARARRRSEEAPPDEPAVEPAEAEDGAIPEQPATAGAAADAASGSASDAATADTGAAPNDARPADRPPFPQPGSSRRAAPPPPPPAYAGGDASVASGDVSRALPRSPTAIRIALALIGWPPLGFAVVALLGETSGCTRFAATCGIETFGFVTWLIQLGVIGVLLAMPRLAAISAAGSVTALAVSLPATMLLSVSGGSVEREASVAALITVLAIAYVAGVGFAAVRWSRRIGR